MTPENKDIVKKILIIAPLLLVCIVASGQPTPKKDKKYAKQRYAELLEKGIRNDSTYYLVDTLNRFKIKIKKNTIHEYSSTQLTVVNQDETGISYFLIFGEDNKIYPSLASFWYNKFKEYNSSYTVSKIKKMPDPEMIIENADIKITTNNKKMTGLMKTMQVDNHIFILQVMTFDKNFKSYQNQIMDIIDSFEYID